MSADRGELRVNLTGNESGFQQMLDRARSQARAFGNSVSHEFTRSWGSALQGFVGGFVGMFSLQALSSMLRGMVDTGKEIRDLSEQLDMNAEDLQRWQKAVDKAGLSFSGFQRIVDTLGQKRFAARTDVKEREALNKLGFSDADILNKNLSASEFTRMALELGKGEEGRAALADILGARSLKYIPTADLMGQQSPTYSGQDLNELKKGEDAERALKRVETKLSAGFLRVLTDRKFRRDYFGGIADMLSGKKPDLGPGEEGYNAAASPLDKAAYRASRAQREAARRARPASELDPLEEVKRQKQEEFAKQQLEAQLRLNATERQSMTITERRLSLARDFRTLKEHVAEEERKQASGWLTETQKKILTPSEQEKLKQQKELELMGLRTQRGSLLNEIRTDHGRFDLSADNMAKAGLFSASQVAFHPQFVVGQQQLFVLRQIERNTSPVNDPHRH